MCIRTSDLFDRYWVRQSTYIDLHGFFPDVQIEVFELCAGDVDRRVSDDYVELRDAVFRSELLDSLWYQRLHSRRT